MRIQTRYKVGDKVVYFGDGGLRHLSEVINVMTCSYMNDVGNVVTNAIYTLQSGKIIIDEDI